VSDANPVLLSIAEAAALVGVSPNTVQAWRFNGWLTVAKWVKVRTGAGRKRMLFTAEAVLAYHAARRVGRPRNGEATKRWRASL